jgi:hypothetical protein
MDLVLSRCRAAGFFGFFKRIKKHLSRHSSVPLMEDYVMPMFRGCEPARAGLTV